MNKKENEQLKKIDELDQQLDYTIKNIGQTNVKPIKLNKKKLVLLMLIPFLFACVISAITSFLVIDPFHWYTKSRVVLEQQQEEKIKKINEEFNKLNLASTIATDDEKTVGDLVNLLKTDSIITSIVDPYEFQISTDRNKTEKLKVDSIEVVNVEIKVITGSLEKTIKVSLNVIVGNSYIMKLNKLFNPNSTFLDTIAKSVQADGTNRISNVIDFIEKHEHLKWIFSNTSFSISRSKKADNEIIASGLKSIDFNLTFNDKNNNKSVTSSFSFKSLLQGKTRKDINQILIDGFKGSVYFRKRHSDKYGFNFFARNVFVDGVSIYQDLIDELIAFAPENNFYLWRHAFEPLDNSESSVSIEIETPNNDPHQIIVTSNGKKWDQVEIWLYFSIGKRENKSKRGKKNRFYINVMERDYEQKDNFLYLNELKDEICKRLFKYEYKTKIDGIKTFGDLIKEIDNEIIKLSIQKIKKPETANLKAKCTITPDDITLAEEIIMSEENNRFSGGMGFNFEKGANTISGLPRYPMIDLSIKLLK